MVITDSAVSVSHLSRVFPMTSVSHLRLLLIVCRTVNSATPEHQKHKHLRAAAAIGFIIVIITIVMPPASESFAIKIQRLREAYIVGRLQRMANDESSAPSGEGSPGDSGDGKVDAGKKSKSAAGVRAAAARESRRGGDQSMERQDEETVLLLKRSKRQRSTLGAAYHHYAV